MRRFVGVGLLLASFVLLATLDAFAQEEKKDKPPAIDSSSLVSNEHVGILKTVPGSDRLFTLEVQSVKYVPAKNPGRISPRLLRNSSVVARNYNNAVNNYAKVANQLGTAQAQAASAKTPRARQSAMNKVNNLSGSLNRAIATLQRAALAAEAQLIREGIAVANAMPGLKPIYSKKTVEFQAMEDVKVRTMVLPEQFDDKGKPKKPTKEELAELKGKDKTLPGYESALEKLEAGQKLRVHLAEKKKSTDSAKDKDNAKEKDPDLDKEKAKDKEKEKDKDGEKKKQVRMIVILEETAANAPKGKKND
jgi:hypothetical protein